MSKGFRVEECQMAMETMRSCLRGDIQPTEIRDGSQGHRHERRFLFYLTAPDADGYIWDFIKHECRQRAFPKIREIRLCMIIGSPECTPFLTMQNLNMRMPEGKEKVTSTTPNVWHT